MQDELDDYKTQDGGETLQDLVKNSYCFTTKGQVTAMLQELQRSGNIQNAKRCTSLEDFEKKHVVYGGQYLEVNDADYEVTQNNQKVNKKFGKLSDIKNGYIDNIIGTNPMSRNSYIHSVGAILKAFVQMRKTKLVLDIGCVLQKTLKPISQ